MLGSARVKRNLVLIVFLSVACSGQSRPIEELPSYRLGEIKIVPYSQRTNTFLEEIRDDRKSEFWNELNLSLFVSVEVSGKAGSYSSDRRVEVTAYEGGRQILRRVARIGVIDENTGKYYVPVWLYGPFCLPVTIRAKLLGQQSTSQLERNLTFECGE